MSVGIFVREPRPGRVKTRLARSLGDLTAARIYAAFVADSVTLALNSTARHCRLFHDGTAPEAWLPGWPPSDRCSAKPQPAGDLGDRLEAAFGHGPCPLLVLGSDSPDLPPHLLAQALAALEEGAQAVLGAVRDGGVWCIGLDRQRRPLRAAGSPPLGPRSPWSMDRPTAAAVSWRWLAITGCAPPPPDSPSRS